jgi:Flp pilus assembly protein TadG
VVHRVEPFAVRIRRDRSERGAILLIMALSMVVLLMLAALVVDIGLKKQIRRQAQNGADAAALASANVIYASGSANFAAAVSTAKSYSYSNFGTQIADWTSCSDPAALAYKPDSVNGDTCISFDSPTSPTLVRVTMPNRTVSFFFGKITGKSSATVNASAEALVKRQGTGPCGFCVLGSGTPYDGQNGDLTVTGDAGVVINGSGTTANNGSVQVNSSMGTTLYNNGTYNGNFIPTPVSMAGNFPDPLSGYPVPDYSSLTAKNGCTGNNATPGIYSSIPTCKLAAGLYVITGSTHISGSKLIDASAGVTLYMTCGSGTTPRPCASGGENGADLICSGNAALQITAPSTGPTQGMAMFFDRNNTSSFDCRGNGAGAITGTIYGSNIIMTMRGNGAGVDYYSMIVVKNADFKGNPSAFASQYNHAQNVQVPGVPPTLVQ